MESISIKHQRKQNLTAARVCCASMAAQRASKILSEVNVDIDLASIDELRELLKTIMITVVVEEEPFSKTVCFNNKHVGKPSVWDGETEEEFKTWS